MIVGLLVRSSMNAAPPNRIVNDTGTKLVETRTPIHGLTSHNSRFDREIDTASHETAGSPDEAKHNPESALRMASPA